MIPGIVSNGMSEPLAVMWVAACAGQAGAADEEYLARVLERAAAERVERVVLATAATDEQMVLRLGEQAARLGVSFVASGTPISGADVDAGASVLGKGAFPCCYTREIQRQILAAGSAGADNLALRIDSGCAFPSLDHPINEANVIVATRWAMRPDLPLEEHWRQWSLERHGVEDLRLMAVLERTFEVVTGALFVSGRPIAMGFFPKFEAMKQAVGSGAALDEKRAALELAGQLTADVKQAAGGMDAFSRREMVEHFKRLELLAECYEAACRALTSADGVATVLALADQIESLFGPRFFGNMPAGMREFAAEASKEPEKAVVEPPRAEVPKPVWDMGNGER